MAKKATQNQDADVLVVTPEGFAEMQKELDECIARATEIALEIDEARKMQDLKENAPYQEAMQRKERNDARMDELKYLISVAKVVENQSKTVVGVGSTVELERMDNKTLRTVTLVGKQLTSESQPTSGKISLESPLGKSIDGRMVGDVVTVVLPAGSAQFKIVKIV